MDWKDIAKELAGRLTAGMALAVLTIIALGYWGNNIPPVYQTLIYIVVIGALLVYAAIEIIGAVARRKDEGAKPDPKPDERPLPPPERDPGPRLPAVPPQQKYLEAILQDCGRFRLAGVDPTAADPLHGGLSLEKMYVSLDTTATVEEKPGKEKGSRPLSALEALQACDDQSMVLLGLPGTGKSTFVRYVSLRMAQALTGGAHRLPELLPGWKTAPLLPIIIPLARLADQLPGDVKKGSADLIEKYIIQMMQADDRMQGFASQVLDALRNQGGLLLFDGLDEVNNLSLRPIITQSIEAFARRYREQGQSRFLVTCRYYSYYHDPSWQLTGWSTYDLALLTPQKIQEFIDAWYNEHTRLELAKKKDYARKCGNLKRWVQPGDRRRLAEIAPFPIILTMMAMVNTHFGDLPDTRAQVYERCIELLLIRWELEREILPGEKQKKSLLDALGVERAKLDGALQEVAYQAHEGWISTNHSGNEKKPQTVLTEDLLRSVLTSKFKDETKVETFLTYCQSANGLIMEQGSERLPDGSVRRIYAFPHRSFQEYLAGRSLVGPNLGPRVRALLDQSDQWRDVILLLGEYLCFEVRDQERLDAILLALAPSALPDKTRDSDWRAAWFAGELLLLYKRIFEPAPQEDVILRRLQQIVSRGELSHPERAAAADVLDELGWQPDDLFSFVPLEHPQLGKFLIAKYPVTNAQYARFLKPENFSEKARDALWLDWPLYDENSGLMKDSTRLQAWDWVQKNIKDGLIQPRYWEDPRFGRARPGAPVVGITWYEANAYCRWLLAHWDDLEEGRQGLPRPAIARLPTEAQWEYAAGGLDPEERYPWDQDDQTTTQLEDILARANVRESNIGRTTPVWMYPRGESTRQVWDLAGNVWEWQANYYANDHASFSLRGGSWFSGHSFARCAPRSWVDPDYGWGDLGFCVVLLPASSFSVS